MSIDHHYQVQQAPTAPPPPPLQPPQPVTLQNYAGAPRVRRPVRVPSILSSLALIIAITALIVVIIDSTRGSQDPVPQPAAAPAAPTYTTEQINAAKQQTCTAAERSIAGVRSASQRPGPAGADDSAGWANAANARVALVAMAANLPAETGPATPPDISDAVKRMSSIASQAALISVSGLDAEANQFTQVIGQLNVAAKEVEQLCQA